MRKVYNFAYQKTGIMESSRKISTQAVMVAESLLQIGSVQLNVNHPFTWVSGIKSPIYCDNRLVNSDVKIRNIVVDAFVKLILDKFKNIDLIAGVVTGGLPIGVLIADRLDLPFIYARQAPKEHGLKKQVEGSYKKGDRVVLIEDHISTGGSSLIALQALRKEGIDVVGLISIMTYNFKSATKKFIENSINHYSICDLETVLNVSVEKGIIDVTDKHSIIEFRDSPETWRNNETLIKKPQFQIEH
jgi:orotate phosphoribosyltransferase